MTIKQQRANLRQITKVLDAATAIARTARGIAHTDAQLHARETASKPTHAWFAFICTGSMKRALHLRGAHECYNQMRIQLEPIDTEFAEAYMRAFLHVIRSNAHALPGFESVAGVISRYDEVIEL
jgi:hypothetical protein